MSGKAERHPLTGLILAAAVVWFCAGSILQGDSRIAVKIGVIIPLTGTAAPRGDDIRKTVELLLARFNDQSKTYRYSMVLEDGKCGLGNSATTAVQKFLSLDRISFLLTGCSGETLQAGPLAERNRVLTIALISNHPAVKPLGDYIFRTYIDAEAGVALTAGDMRSLGKERIALLTEENSFSAAIRDLLKRELGNRLVYAADFAGDTTDFAGILMAARAQKPDAYFFNNVASLTYLPLYRQARQLGITELIYAYRMPGDPDVMLALGSANDNVRYFDVPTEFQSGGGFELFRREFMRLHPGGPSMEYLLRGTYDALQLIVSGVEKFGPNSERIKEFLYNYDGEGALGRLRFDANGDIRDVHWVLRRMDAGVIKPAN